MCQLGLAQRNSSWAGEFNLDYRRFPARYSRFYNRKHGAKPLTQFEGGESVHIKTDKQKVWGNPTVVVRAGMPIVYCTFARRFYVQTQPASPTGNSCTSYRTSTVLQHPIRQRSLKDKKSFLNLLEVPRLLVRLNQLFQPQLPCLVE